VLVGSFDTAEVAIVVDHQRLIPNRCTPGPVHP
jgi:hypothetical protein